MKTKIMITLTIIDTVYERMRWNVRELSMRSEIKYSSKREPKRTGIPIRKDK